MNHRLPLTLITIVLSAVVLLSSTPCWAQTSRATIRAQLTGDAQLAWDGAIELYEAGDYEGALVQFKRAHELSDNPRVLFDVGVCLKNIAHYSQAIEAWETELAAGKGLARVDVQALKTAIATLRPFVSTLEVSTELAGAIVFVDDVEVGRTPLLAPVPVNVGQRAVRLEKPPEYLPLEKKVDVIKGKPASVSFELERAIKMAEVSVRTPGVTGVTLFLDGRELGTTPFAGAVPAGAHTFVARAPGHQESLKTVVVTVGQPLSLTLAMVAQETEGKLRVIANRSDARIEIDGSVASGTWTGLLAAGGHRLVVSREGYETYEADISLSAGQDRTLDIALKKSQSWVWWTVSLAAVVGGGALATGYLLQPRETPAVPGTLRPGLVSF